jgi:hypothetical protein
MATRRSLLSAADLADTTGETDWNASAVELKHTERRGCNAVD